MPTYEYVCTKCGNSLEVVQSIHDPSLTTCPVCGDGRLRKVFGNVGVVFKGSGFYRTDNRSRTKGGAGAPKPESSAKSDSGGKSEPRSGSGSSTPSGPAKASGSSAPSGSSGTSGSSTPPGSASSSG